jgi:hypothetical protein
MSINLNSLFHKYDEPDRFNAKNNKLSRREFAKGSVREWVAHIQD